MNPKAATSIDVELGRRLRAIRKAAGLTQEEVAEKVGLTFQQIQKFRLGLVIRPSSAENVCVAHSASARGSRSRFIRVCEWGTNRMSVARMIQIAAALDQSASIFIDGLEHHLGGSKVRSTLPTSADVGLAYPRAKRVAAELKASAGRTKANSKGK